MSALYDKARDAFLNGSINWTADTVKAALVSSVYTPDLANHQFLSDLGANLLGTDQPVVGKSSSAGVANATSPVTWTAVAAGATVKYLAVYKSTGVAATSPLICLIDTSTGVAMPFATNGGNIVFTWDAGANKIFKL